MAENPRSSSGTLPPSFVGADEHGPGLHHLPPPGDAAAHPSFAPGARLRSMTSIAWGGVAREVTSEHGQPCGYCGVNWPTGVGMPAHTHPGVDISMVVGTPLYAAAAGKVTFAGWSPKYYRPRQVQVTTPDGQLHIYAHMWSVAPGIAAGAWVNRGDYLGTSGEQTYEGTETPDGTGGHLHFEARNATTAVAIDPEPILTAAVVIPDDTTQQQNSTGLAVAPGDRLEVTGDGLRLRENPGTSAGIIRQLNTGMSICVLSEPQAADGYTWARVRTTDGAAGWVAVDYCKPSPLGPCGFEPRDRIELADESVRFRSGPGLSASIHRQFARGEQVCVTGSPTKADGYTWYPVRTSAGEEGWVAGDFCDLVEADGCAEQRNQSIARANWPTAEAIDERIRLSNHVNGRTSKLTGMGKLFVQLGERYGINPAIAVAIAQRECQMGADGSHLPERLNNFGGITAGGNGEYPGPCGKEYFGDRYWKVYCSPEDGVEGIFRLLDAPLYRDTGGRFEAVMQRYSPEFENPWTGSNSIWEVFSAVGDQLGVTVGRDTNIYG